MWQLPGEGDELHLPDGRGDENVHCYFVHFLEYKYMKQAINILGTVCV